ncbi:MAG: hypothetical protein WCI54_16270 [Bacteroidia bacterium]|jgi:hypothetical protein
MKKIRIGFVFLAAILIVINLGLLVFGNMDSHGRIGSYLGNLGMVLLISSMIVGIKNDKKKQIP